MFSDDDTAPPDLSAAIEQLAEYFGFQAHYDFTVDGKPYRITYRQFLPADVEHKLQRVDVDLEDCDRAKMTLPSGKSVESPNPAIPLRRNGELLRDGRDALRLIAMWGEERYRAFEAAGGPPDMLTVVWAKQDAEYDAWRKSKSALGN